MRFPCIPEDEADFVFQSRFTGRRNGGAINANSYLQLDVIGIADGGAGGHPATEAQLITSTAIAAAYAVGMDCWALRLNLTSGDEPSKSFRLGDAVTQSHRFFIRLEYN